MQQEILDSLHRELSEAKRALLWANILNWTFVALIWAGLLVDWLRLAAPQ